MAPKSEGPAVDLASLKLPLTVVSLIDLGRLQRELEAVELFLAQAEARTPGKSLSLPRTTQNLESVSSQNKLNLLNEPDRQVLKAFFDYVRDKAPHIHISYASDPSAAFLQRITSWFRTSIHPLTVLQIGLQPTIAAGCVLVTNSKYFDLSLRKDFDSKRMMLMDKIRETRQTAQAAPTVRQEPVAGEQRADLKEYAFTKPVVDQAPAQASAAPQETPNV